MKEAILEDKEILASEFTLGFRLTNGVDGSSKIDHLKAQMAQIIEILTTKTLLVLEKRT